MTTVVTIGPKLLPKICLPMAFTSDQLEDRSSVNVGIFTEFEYQ